MTQVGIEDAYAEACQALGESIVVQRLQAKELQRLAALVPVEDSDEPESGG